MPCPPGHYSLCAIHEGARLYAGTGLEVRRGYRVRLTPRIVSFAFDEQGCDAEVLKTAPSFYTGPLKSERRAGGSACASASSVRHAIIASMTPGSSSGSPKSSTSSPVTALRIVLWNWLWVTPPASMYWPVLR